MIPLAMRLEVHSVVAACAGDEKRISGVIRPGQFTETFLIGGGAHVRKMY